MSAPMDGPAPVLPSTQSRRHIQSCSAIRGGRGETGTQPTRTNSASPAHTATSRASASTAGDLEAIMLNARVARVRKTGSLNNEATAVCDRSCTRLLMPCLQRKQDIRRNPCAQETLQPSAMLSNSLSRWVHYNGAGWVAAGSICAEAAVFLVHGRQRGVGKCNVLLAGRSGIDGWCVCGVCGCMWVYVCAQWCARGVANKE